jgi:DNA-binding transcriptional LysR family regulator
MVLITWRPALDPARLDVRLLTMLEAIHRLGSLTAAGEALGLSQPAISHALGRLRAAFGDELFVRTAHGMRPTPRAGEIAASARRVMALLRAELGAPTPFDPRTVLRTFRFCMSDVGEMVFLPRLVERLRREAPHCNVATVSMTPRALAEALDDGSVDLAIGYFPDLASAGLAQAGLFERGFRCLAAASHPRLRRERIGLDDFLAEAHVVVTSEGRVEERFERFLKEKRLARRVQVSVPHMLAVPMIVANSDLIATVPDSAAVAFARYPGLQLHTPPIELPLITVAQHWSLRVDNDPVNRWLRALVTNVFSEIDGRSMPRAASGGRKTRRSTRPDAQPGRRRSPGRRSK